MPRILPRLIDVLYNDKETHSSSQTVPCWRLKMFRRPLIVKNGKPMEATYTALSLPCLYDTCPYYLPVQIVPTMALLATPAWACEIHIGSRQMDFCKSDLEHSKNSNASYACPCH